MKKNLLIALLATVSVSIFSCQKNYAPLQKSSGVGYQSEKKSIPLMSDAEFNEITVSKTEKKSNEVEVSKPESESTPLVIQNSEKIELTKEQKQLIRKENSVKFDHRIIEAQTGKKLSFVQKTALKKLEKKANVNAAAGNTDILALLALIFGAAGLFLMWGGIGWLVGIAGFILGLIALKRGTPNRTMAILGVVFGGIAILLGLLVFTLFAALFSFGV